MNVTIPYSPRWYQQEIHEAWDERRFGAVVMHRRAGKTVCLLNHLIRDALRTDMDDWRGAYIAPTLVSCKQLVWDYLKLFTRVLPVEIRKYNESELRMDLANGARLRLYGADHPDSLRGIYLDACCIDEYDIVKPAIFTEVLRPALSDRKGRCVLAGTFKGTNGPLGQMYDNAESDPEWFRKNLNVVSTGASERTDDEAEFGELTKSELAAAHRVMSKEEYDREYLNVRNAAVRGAIFGRLVDVADTESRLTRVPHDPALDTITAWDLGMADSTAVWFVQQAGTEIRVIDYYENSGESLAHYCKIVREKPYTYREHIAPHDISVRELGTGKTRLEVAASLGIHFRQLPRVTQRARSEVEERIEQGRLILPRCYFDLQKCKRGIDALRSWHRAENAQTGELRNEPIHDWSSHGADAFSYLAMGIRSKAKIDRPEISANWVT